jgi:hypothetical protein
LRRRAHLNNFNINFLRVQSEVLFLVSKLLSKNNLNAPNSGRIKIESEDFLFYDVPGDGQCFFHALSLANTGNLDGYGVIFCGELILIIST